MILNDLKAAQTRSSVLVSLAPLITGVDPPLVDPASLKPITLTVANVDFKPVAQVDLKVRLVTGGDTIQVDTPTMATEQPHVYKVRFMPPKDPPTPLPPDGYSPELLVKDSLTIKSNVKLRYR